MYANTPELIMHRRGRPKNNISHRRTPCSPSPSSHPPRAGIFLLALVSSFLRSPSNPSSLPLSLRECPFAPCTKFNLTKYEDLSENSCLVTPSPLPFSPLFEPFQCRAAFNKEYYSIDKEVA